MTTVTTIPIGSTGSFLEGLQVSTFIRETVVIADPQDLVGYSPVVSNQPAGGYGQTHWNLGTTNVNVLSSVSLTATGQISSYVVSNAPLALVGTSQVFGQVSSFPIGTTQVTGTVSTQVVSSIPFFVAQSSAPWSTFAVGSTFIAGTTQVQGQVSSYVVSSVPHALVGTSQIFGTVSSQIVSSIPFFVAQSSAPWSTFAVGSTWIQGTSQILGQVSTFPTGTTMVNLVSSVTQNVSVTALPAITGAINVSSATAVVSTWPLNTTGVNIQSSIPFFVAQSSAPWSVVLSSVASSGTLTTSWILANTVNSTAIKAGPGVLLGYDITNVSSTWVYIKLYNASTAQIVTSIVPYMNLGVGISTARSEFMDVGINFSTGIAFAATIQSFIASTAIAPLASTVIVNLTYK